MMRYLVLLGILVVVAVVAVAGKRGSMSRRPPIEIFPDMDRQPKLRPQAANAFFPNGLSSQPLVSGTVARSEPIEVGGTKVFPFEDHPVNTGKLPGTTNFVANSPLPVTAQLLARGQQRYQINCLPCHGGVGDGKGITSKLGMVGAADLHQLRLVQMGDGEIFNTITHGKNLMGGYGANIDVPDRWAIVAYVRALQRARLAVIEDVPMGERGKILNALPVAQ
jgi:mono/diheme cytochrome c family protein